MAHKHAAGWQNETNNRVYTINHMEEKATKLKIKPFSVNDAWKGKRFRTQAYKDFAKEVMLSLPRGIEIPKDKPLRATFWWGFSSAASDYDNPIKPLQDVLAELFEFNDKMIVEGHQYKYLVPKGQEYLKFLIEPIV